MRFQTVADSTQAVSAQPNSPEGSRKRKPRPAPLTLPPDGDGLIREEQACAALQVGRTTLWRWAAAGRLRPVRLGRMTRWRISDLRAILEGDGAR